MARRDQVLSLFGASPAQILQQIREEEQTRMAQMRSPEAKVGFGLGRAIGRAFGGEDPRVTQARQKQALIQQARADVQQQRAQAQAQQQAMLDERLGGLEGALATETGSGLLPKISPPKPKVANRFVQQAELYDRMADRLEAGGFMAEAEQARTSATEQRVKGLQMQKMVREEESAIAEEQRKAQERQLNTKRRVVAGDILRGRGKPDMATAVEQGILPLDTLKDALKEPEAEYKVVGKSLVKIPPSGQPVAVFSPPPEPQTKYELLTEQEVKDTPELTPGVAYQRNKKTGEITAVTGDAKVGQAGDYQINRYYDENGKLTTSMELIPGSKSYNDLQERIRATSQGIASRAQKVDLMSDFTTKAIELLEKDSSPTDWRGAAIRDFANIPFIQAFTAGSPTMIFDGYLTVIKSNIGFDKLDQMRRESPTGGALGQVAILELIALQNSIAPLEPNIGDEMLSSLKRIKETYETNMEILANNYTNEVLNQYGMQIAIQYRTVDPVTGQPLQPEGSTQDPLGIR